MLLPAATLAAKTERWICVRTPEFILMTTVSKSEATVCASEFAQFFAALHRFFPVERERLPKLTIVLFPNFGDFADYRPVRLIDGKSVPVSGYFARRDSWAMAGMVNANFASEVKRTIFHEGTHWLLSAFQDPTPRWIQEGIAEVFSTFQFDGREETWGDAIDGHIALLQGKGLIPLSKFLYMSGGEYLSDDIERDQLVYAESWVFLHYLLFGRDGKQGQTHEKMLWDYLRLSRTKHPDEAFQTAMGCTYEQMDAKLGAYVRDGNYYRARRAVDEISNFEVTPATEVEIEDMKARLLLIAQRNAQAIAHAEEAIRLAPDDPRGYEALGYARLQTREKQSAVAAFSSALQKGTRDFRVCYELGLAAQEATQTGLGVLSSIGGSDARKAANYYKRTINLNPLFLPAYQSLAGLLEAVDPFQPQDKDFIAQGRKLLPDDGLLLIGAAVCEHRIGNTAASHAQLDAIVQAEDGKYPEAVTAYARRLNEAWNQNDVTDLLQEALQKGNSSETLALVEKRLSQRPDAAERQQLETLRKSLRGGVQMEKAKAALADGQTTKAKFILNGILDSQASEATKREAQRLLEAITKPSPAKPN